MVRCGGVRGLAVDGTSAGPKGRGVSGKVGQVVLQCDQATVGPICERSR